MRKGIRTSVLLLALTPTVVVATLLVAYLTSMRLRDVEQSFVDRGQTMANQLAVACERGVLSNDIGLLEKLTRSLLNESDVSAVIVQDNSNRVLVDAESVESRRAKANSPARPAASPRLESLVLEAPIYRARLADNEAITFALMDRAGERAVLPDIIGRVRVELSRGMLLQHQQAVIKTSIWLTVGCLLLALILAQLMGRRITNPLLRLDKAVQALRNAPFDVVMETTPSGELDRLERGIDALGVALKTSHEQIQEQVEEATAELREKLAQLQRQNASLETTREQALQVSRIKSEFLANMSHEIRTPMNGVMGFITLLSKTELKHTQRAYLETLRASAENLMVILNDILDFSKIEAGKFKIRRRNFDLREVLENAVLLFAANAHQKGLNLILDIEPDVPSQLVGDAPRIAQIVTNFVSNAVKFTDKGSVEVRVSKAQECPQTVTLHVKIRDTGVGIAPEDQKRLFTAFDQLDTPPTQRQSGTGLGLAISQRLVAMMNGKIYVESRLGAGTTFGVSLVIGKRDQTQIKAREQAGAIGPVLVVSRDPMLTRAVAHILQFAGTQPRCVEHFNMISDALRGWLSDTDKLQAIIVDNNNLGQGAEPLNGELRALGVQQKCPLILMVGSEDLPDTASYSGAFQTIFFAYKPPTSRELLPMLGASAQSTSALSASSNESGGEQSLAYPRTTIRVLLADDNLINRRLARIFLDQLGADVDEAHTGAEAVELSCRHNYNLVLMDIHMPEMDGLEATRRLRTQVDNPNRNTPVIALTADALARERDLYLNAGMNDHLTKPITESTLQQMLGKWCPSYLGHGATIRASEV